MPAHLPTSSSTFPPPPSARHYHPTLSIWLSVDPMAYKYPGVSPYTYCTDNPVMIKDPNGTHGVVVLHQERNLDIVWRGKTASRGYRIHIIQEPE